MVLCDVRWSDAKDCSYGDRKNYTDVLGGTIMRIEHVALYVNDLENTKKFFMKYFRAKSN